MPPSGVPFVGPRLPGVGRKAVRAVSAAASASPPLKLGSVSISAPALVTNSVGSPTCSVVSCQHEFGVSSAAVSDDDSSGIGVMGTSLGCVVEGDVNCLIEESLVSGPGVECVAICEPSLVGASGLAGCLGSSQTGIGIQSMSVSGSGLEVDEGTVGSGYVLGVLEELLVA